MKKSFLVVLALAGMSISSFAQANVDVDDADEPSQAVQIKNKGGEQPKRTPEERAKQQSQKMAVKLGLSEEQKEKVYKLSLLKARKMDQLKVRSDNDKKAKITQAQQIQEENDAALKNDVLTPEQYAKYVQIKEDQKKKRAEGKGHGGGHKHGKKK